MSEKARSDHEWLARQCDILGRDLPKLIRKPTLHEELTPVWEAYLVLAPRRQIHFGGVGAIPISEIEAYCRLSGVEAYEERMEMLWHLNVLDMRFLSWHRDRHEKDKPDAGI